MCYGNQITTDDMSAHTYVKTFLEYVMPHSANVFDVCQMLRVFTKRLEIMVRKQLRTKQFLCHGDQRPTTIHCEWELETKKRTANQQLKWRE